MDIKVSVSYLADGHKAGTRKVLNDSNSGSWLSFHWPLHKNPFPSVQFESTLHAKTFTINWTLPFASKKIL